MYFLSLEACMGGLFLQIKRLFIVLIITFSSVYFIQLHAEEPLDGDPVEEPEEVTILAVKQDGFKIEDRPNFRLVGSTRFAGSGISIVQNQGSTAGSVFTANRIFMEDSENAGFSTYFEMVTSGGGGMGFADGFTFIVSQFTNVLGLSGGAIGYGGIKNSVAVLFDSWDNGGQPPLCISLGLEGRQLPCSNRVAGNGLTYYIWIDYSKANQTLEVRMRTTPGDRPINTIVPTYRNLDLTDNIGNSFYAGFTSATGGAFQNTFLRRWYFSAFFSPSGLDPKGTYEVEVIRPLKPSLDITHYDPERRGWVFIPTRNVNEEFAEVSFLFGLNNAGAQSFSDTSFIPDGTKEVRVFARSPGGIVSEPSEVVNFNTGLYFMNYQGGRNVSRSYPSIGTYELYDAQRKGYTLLGWTKAINYVENDVIESSSFFTDQVFIAHWELTQFTVSFNTLSDTVIEPINTNIDVGFSLPNNPSKPFHTFVGWFTDENYETPFDFDTFDYDDVTLYAKWEVATYNVSFYYDDFPQLSVVDHGSILNKPLDPVREDDFFDGFYTQSNYVTPYVFDRSVVRDENIYVKWVDAIPVRAFMSGVDGLPEKLELSAAHQEMLINLRNQHLNLSSDQLRFLDETFEQTLSYYEAWMNDLIAASIVNAMIGALPWIPTVDDKTLIESVLAAYNALTDVQKTYIPNQALHKILDVSKQNGRLVGAKAVDLQLDVLPVVLTYSNLDAINFVIQEYNQLTELEKALISPLNQLKIDLAMQLQEDLITVRTFVERVDAKADIDADTLAQFIQAYDALTDAQKQQVPAVVTNRLMLSSKFHQDKEQTTVLETMISKLRPRDAQSVEEVVTLFNTMSQDQINLLSDDSRETLNDAISRFNRNEGIVDGSRDSYFPWLAIVVTVTFIAGSYFFYKLKHIGL